MELVLASTSPSRRKILADAGIRARAVPPGVSEDLDEDDPVRRAIALARRKADAVRERDRGALVLAADQVLHDGAEVFGKPRDPGDHARRLGALRGRWHRLVTAWVLLGPDWREEGHEETRLLGRADVTDAEIAAYVATGEGTHCAGGYAIEGQGGFLFERVEGDLFNVLGLPLLPVISALRRHGWRYGGV